MKFRVMAILWFILVFSFNAYAGMLYVKTGGTGDGTSWNQALGDPQDAIELAAADDSYDQVWVAAGTYKPAGYPNGGSGSREVHFSLRNGVSVYGGFAGNETDLHQRNFENNKTIFSGDIGIEGDDSDNVYHVFYHLGPYKNRSAVLDGIIIEGGHANSDWPHNAGGGIYNYYSSPNLTNLTIIENIASGSGGGIYNTMSYPAITNTTICKNEALNGGGINNYMSDPFITNVTICENEALNGGGIYNSGSSPILTNVTITGNKSAGTGGGIYNNAVRLLLYNYSYPIIKNSILWDNGQEIYNSDESSPTISWSIVQGGYPDGINIITDDPLLQPLADNGGFTKTHAIPSNSPAYAIPQDAGSGNWNDAPDTDQRGQSRSRKGYRAMGAYEDSLQTGLIKGKVTNEYGEPLENIEVIVYVYSGIISPASWWQFKSVFTDSQGKYEIDKLEADVYRIGFQNPSKTYSNIYYNDQNDINEADDIHVTAGSIAGGINCILPGFSAIIQGTVTGQDGENLQGIVVSAEGKLSTIEAETDSNGVYKINGLMEDDYTLSFSDPSGVYETIYYDNKLNRSDADLITLADGEMLTEFDYRLTVKKTKTQYFPLPDTGQAYCYDYEKVIDCPEPGQPFYGQDAQYPRLSRSYTKIGSGGSELPDYEEHIDNGGKWIMTRDNVTGLLWEIKTESNMDDHYDWDSAKAYTDSLELGGLSDWRLPNVTELSSLLNSGVFSGELAVDSKWFPNTSPATYWSSVAVNASPDEFWAVSFDGWYSNFGVNKSRTYHVRAVHNGEHSQKKIVDNRNGTITDSSTGLMWQKATAPDKYDWKAALEYAENLTLAGNSDWRLPNRNELLSLVDYSRSDPATDPMLADETLSSTYWSSTTGPHADPYKYAWHVDFAVGSLQDVNHKQSEHHVRVVRGGYSHPHQGSLRVTIRPQTLALFRGAWRRVGTDSWLKSGETEIGIMPGQYKVEFKANNGFLLPEEKIVNIEKNNIAEISGTYSAISSDNAFPFPDSGQNLCYDNDSVIECPQPGEPFYGQDPQFNRLARSYTKLGPNGLELRDDERHVDEGGQWIMTRDNVTGLIWELKTEHNLQDKYLGVDARDFIDKLNQDVYAGFSDWRMPSVKELSSILYRGLSYTQVNLSANLQWFPNTMQGNYWTSTGRPGIYFLGGMPKWFVNFQEGLVDSIVWANQFYVRAVRPDTHNTFECLIENNDKTISDPNTGLMWKRFDSPVAEQNLSSSNPEFSWEEALAYAETQQHAGYDDWRIPSINELQTIVDYSVDYPAIYPLFGENINSTKYWSSTTNKFDSSEALQINFDTGSLASANKKDQSGFIIVRTDHVVKEGNIQIFIQSEKADNSGAKWRIQGTTTWYESGEIASNIPIGTYIIEFRTVSGWRPEGPITVTVKADETSVATGYYIEQATVLPGVMMLLLDDK